MSEASLEVTFADFRRELIDRGGPVAELEYRKWHERKLWPGYEEVIPFVENFSHKALFRVTEDMLNDVKSRSGHALGDLQKEVVEKEGIEDFHAPFANQFLFHKYLEDKGEVPTMRHPTVSTSIQLLVPSYCNSARNVGLITEVYDRFP